MSKEIYKNNLKYNLWPNHAVCKPETPDLIKSLELSETQLKNIYGKLDFFLSFHPHLAEDFGSALSGCVPLRRYAVWGLWEATAKSGNNKYLEKLLPAFIVLHKTLLDTKLNGCEAFDKVCEIIVDELDTTHKAFQKNHGWFFMGSRLAASHWGSFVAKGIVCAAAAVAKYSYLNQPLSRVNVLGDSIPILNIVYEYGFSSKGSHSRRKMAAIMLATAAEILGPARPYARVASALSIPEASFHALPLVLSLSQSWGAVSGVTLLSGYLAAQDYVHYPGPKTQNTSKTLTSIIEAYSLRLDGAGQFTRHEKLTSMIHRKFWREFVLDPLLISDAVCKDLAERDTEQGKEFAELIRPSVIQYFKGLAGEKLENAVRVFKSGGEFWTRHKIEEIDAKLLTMLKGKISQPDMLSTNLVTYIHDETHGVNITESTRHIKEILKIASAPGFTVGSSEDSKLKSLIPTKNLFEIHGIAMHHSVGEILMLVMYQSLNYDLKGYAVIFWREYIETKPTNFRGSTRDIIQFALLSNNETSISGASIHNNKGMIEKYDLMRFENFVYPKISKDVENVTPVFSSLYHTEAWKHDSVYVSIDSLFRDSIQNTLVRIIDEKMQNISRQVRDVEYSGEVHTNLKNLVGLAENVGINKGDAEFIFENGISKNADYYSRFQEYSTVQTRIHQIKGRLGHMYIIFFGHILPKYTSLSEGKEKGPQIFADFFEKCLREHIFTVFPTMRQSVFLDFWSHSLLTKEGRYMSYDSLISLYHVNPSIFWLPLLHLVIEDKMDESRGKFKLYMDMIKDLNIPEKDAGNYLDFICMWVYPFTFNNVDMPRMVKFYKALEKTGYENLDQYSYIVRHNKMYVN